MPSCYWSGSLWQICNKTIKEFPCTASWCRDGAAGGWCAWCVAIILALMIQLTYLQHLGVARDRNRGRAFDRAVGVAEAKLGIDIKAPASGAQRRKVVLGFAEGQDFMYYAFWTEDMNIQPNAWQHL